ncbi:hypothetical protein GCM10025881_22040 [Pseudolysinimonas kribbensis]|uniref:tRNA(Ile)-lysidine synthase n=1 Tax=Pseudolysinimonas kribbensis TaxID=433641 RepID=A0ABQ6K8R9_9MICO|nr:hypothetical protein GCM10025881_22040 [Pseudolysinimonas kribbensis]
MLLLTCAAITLVDARSAPTDAADRRRAPRGPHRPLRSRRAHGRRDPVVRAGGAERGPDSLALAAAVAFEAPRAGVAAGAVVVDHGLQTGSARVAERAALQARDLGLDPVTVVRVEVGAAGGPEAAARDARYAALEQAARAAGADAVLLGHTLDDQAETVLLGLARGSGAASLQGMAPMNGLWRRPLLGIRRAQTRQACADAGLEPWHDPHNDDPGFARVRVRRNVLPVLERELGPGVAEALARTAEQLREDNEALDAFAGEVAEDLADHAEAGLTLPVTALAANPRRCASGSCAWPCGASSGSRSRARRPSRCAVS